MFRIAGQTKEKEKTSLEIMNFAQRLIPQGREDLETPIRAGYFTRGGRLKLPITLGLMVNLVRPGERVGYQELIDRFYSDTGLAEADKPRGYDRPPDQAAFCRARGKLPREVFQEIFGNAVEDAQERAEGLGTCRWKGLRPKAVDGVRMNLPWSPDLEKAFGVPEGAHYPQMLVCTLFDVLAKIPENVVWGPYCASERAMLELLYENLEPGDLLLADRGFPSFELLCEPKTRGFELLVRLPHNGLFGDVQAFLEAGHTDGEVLIRPPEELVRERRKAGEPAPEPVTLRIVKLEFSNGKSAVFATTLMDREKFPATEIGELYHLRWEEEEFFKLVKELLGGENYRGQSQLFIEQELLSILLYCLMTRILMMECAAKHSMQLSSISQKHAFLSVSRYMDLMLTAKTERQYQILVNRCVDEIAWRRYKKRPGRSYPRRSKSSFGKWGRKSEAA